MPLERSWFETQARGLCPFDFFFHSLGESVRQRASARIGVLAVRAVFGGSFNPPHVGHVLAAQYVLSVGLADVVMVVPVFEHAFQKGLTPFQDRIALVEAAFFRVPGTVVSDLESRLPRPSFTLRTVRALVEKHPQDELRLLVGSDVAREMPHWYRAEELLGLASPLVLGRVGELEGRSPPAVLPGISSTQVRKWLADQQSQESREALALAVPAAVLTEIERRGLYGPP